MKNSILCSFLVLGFALMPGLGLTLVGGNQVNVESEKIAENSPGVLTHTQIAPATTAAATATTNSRIASAALPSGSARPQD